MTDWSVPTQIDLYSQLAVALEACQDNNGVPILSSGHVKVCEKNYGPVWFGAATVFPTRVGGDCDSCVDASNHIVKAAVRLNNYYTYAYSSYRRYVYCHEVGHTLALYHSSSRSSCMWAEGWPAVPEQHDYDVLSSGYTHTDSYNTSHSTGSGGCRPVDAALTGMTLAVEPYITFELWPKVAADGRTIVGIKEEITRKGTATRLVAHDALNTSGPNPPGC